MKNIELFKKAMGTLFYSWGSDTPEEVYWGANELLDWAEKEFNIELPLRFERDEETYEDNYEEVIKMLEDLK